MNLAFPVMHLQSWYTPCTARGMLASEICSCSDRRSHSTPRKATTSDIHFVFQVLKPNCTQTLWNPQRVSFLQELTVIFNRPIQNLKSLCITIFEDQYINMNSGNYLKWSKEMELHLSEVAISYDAIWYLFFWYNNSSHKDTLTMLLCGHKLLQKVHESQISIFYLLHLWLQNGRNYK